MPKCRNSRRTSACATSSLPNCGEKCGIVVRPKSCPQPALAPTRMSALKTGKPAGKPAPQSARYNREVRFASVLLLILCFAACQHGIQSNEAVRQGVIDHLKKAGMNVDAMDLTWSSVEFNGNKASAQVSMTAKGAPPGGMPMSFKYLLEQQDKKWVVTGRDTSGDAHGKEAAPAASPHGGGAMPGAMPGAANPHGGGAAMPSPNDLPPAKKK